MRIHHVTLTGFGPFRGTESVDFDAFADDGIFLITGRTGAGKTSLLDAITYALFGRIPRYDEAAGAKVRSDHLGPTDLCEVTVEFSAASGRHRVRRSPAYMRPKQRGEGLTPVKASFELAELRDGDWVVTETKEGNADRHVSDVLPLTAEQFQQVILLAQGQFQEFLVAGSDKRREVFSKLFDTSRFTAYSQDLDEQARVLRREVEKLSTQVGAHATALAQQVGVALPEHVDATTGAGLVDWAAERLAEQRDEFARTRAVAAAAAEALSEARERHDAAADLQRRQRARAQALADERDLAERSEAVEDQRTQVEVARRAALSAQACAALERAEATVTQVQPALAAAVTAWRDCVDPGVSEAGPSVDEARASADATAAELVTVDEAFTAEAALGGLTAERDRAAAALERFEAELVADAAQRGEAEESRSGLQARRTELDALVAALSDAPAALKEAQEGLRAAEERDALVVALGSAIEVQQERAAHATAAQQHRDALVARQFAQYAGVLAGELVAGEPCLVCGAVEHPSPASLTDGHVDASAVRSANDEVSRTQREAQTAAEQVARVGAQIEALDERLAGGDLETWTLAVKEARVKVEDLAALTDEARTLDAQLVSVTARITRLTSTLEAAQEERLRLAAQVTSAEQTWTAARQRVEQARGEFGSVGQRREHLRARLEVAQQAEAAVRAVDDATRRCDEARAAVATALQEHGFDDVAAVRAAELAPEVLEQTARLVTEHDARSRAVAERLAHPDLQDLPEEPIDLTPLADALTSAVEAHTDAAQQAGAAEQQLRTVENVVQRIESALSGAAAALAEYEVVHSLAATLRGQGQNEKKMALEAFALAAELEEIVAAANLRLTKMTSGRFEFRHSDTEDSKRVASGLGLDVLDAHTGEARSPKSLSGGEKFQASLALALGLAEVVTARAGGLRLDTLFIDEGFGTLDPETLESTMATLDGLREGGRTIGLISHVVGLKESIASQLRVDVTPGGWSTVRQR